jgi:hypothetical protein
MKNFRYLVLIFASATLAVLFFASGDFSEILSGGEGIIPPSGDAPPPKPPKTAPKKADEPPPPAPAPAPAPKPSNEQPANPAPPSSGQPPAPLAEGEEIKMTKPSNTKSTISKALKYLANEQSKDGSWQCKMSALNGVVVTTSYCGLAFMANGSTPSKGTFKENVKNAVDFVAKGVIMPSPNFTGRVRGTQGNWNQENWKLAIGACFLCEAQAASPDSKVKSAIEYAVHKLERNQEPSGGWGHGPGGPNALGYVELEIVSNYAVAAMGMAKDLGVNVDKEKFEKAVKYIEDCTSDGGGTNYSTRPNQNGTMQAGRTGGAIFALAAAEKTNSPKYAAMLKNLDANLDEIPVGHASVAMHFIGGALGCVQNGKNSWAKYVNALFKKMLDASRPDGSFRSIVNPVEVKSTGDGDEDNGPYYNTGIYTLALSLDLGHLKYMSGVFSEKKKK